jgi:Recombination endonuclease VII
MVTMICRICNAEQPQHEFSHKRKGTEARRDTCKTCHAKQERWYREQRKEVLGADHPLLLPLPRAPRTPFEEPPERTCLMCKETKPIETFMWADKHHRLHRNICKQCNTEEPKRRREKRRIASMQPRICTTCQEEKPAEEFSWKNKKDFLRQPLCKPCALVQSEQFRTAQREQLGEEGMTALHKARYAKDRENQLAYHRDYYQANGEKLRAKSQAWYQANREHALRNARIRKLRSNFGLTPEDYTAMLEAQGGVCALCQSNRGRKLVVDHDHVTGKVRGLLCCPCNSFLGRIKESVDALDRIKAYLTTPAREPEAITFPPPSEDWGTVTHCLIVEPDSV